MPAICQSTNKEIFYEKCKLLIFIHLFIQENVLGPKFINKLRAQF